MFIYEDETFWLTTKAMALAVQILMFLLTAVYTLSITSKSEGTVKQRHLTIGLFGIAMILLIAFQMILFKSFP